MDVLPVYKFKMPIINSNMFIIISGKKALMIDPNVNEEAFLLLKENQVEQIVMILTHEHFDHISGVNFYRNNWNCMVYANNICKNMVEDPVKNLSKFFMAMFISKLEDERKLAEELFEEDYYCKVDIGFEGEWKLDFGGYEIKLIETPGHSMGSICIMIGDEYIFTGDSLVQGAKTITRLPGGNKKLFNEVTVPFLETLPDDIIVFPGHGEEGKKGLL